MSYRLLIEERAVEELNDLPGQVQDRVKRKVREVLAVDPSPGGRGDIKKVQGSKFFRLRVGDYRVFFDFDSGEETVWILSVRHRSKAYRDL